MNPFKRNHPDPAPEPVVDAPADEAAPQDEGRWGGPICFSDGWYYPVLVDDYNNELGPDRTRKLVYREDQTGGYYEFARDTDRSHYETYGRAEKVLEPQGEVTV